MTCRKHAFRGDDMSFGQLLVPAHMVACANTRLCKALSIKRLDKVHNTLRNMAIRYDAYCMMLWSNTLGANDL